MKTNILRILLKITHDIIFSSKYRDQSRTDPTKFTRNRKMSFPNYILFMLRKNGKSMQNSINSFMKESKINETYSKQAFSKQRQYIRPEAIKTLFEMTGREFYNIAKPETYRDYILAAIDGSRINLPVSDELQQVFGFQSGSGSNQNQALVSCMYDVLNGMYLDASINPCRANERKLALGHLDALDRFAFSKVILIMDRGYPSGELFSKISEKGVKFVTRCDPTHIRGIKTDSDDCITEHIFKSYPQPVKIRIVRIRLSSGKEEILATNLFDSEFTPDDFAEIYRLRWEIESSFNHLKNHVEVENFTGNTAIAVEQDFYAALYLINLSNGLIVDMKDEISKKHNNGDNKYEYKQNTAITIGKLKTSVVEMLLVESNITRGRILADIERELVKSVTAIRPGRNFERKKKHASARFNNYKPV